MGSQDKVDGTMSSHLPPFHRPPLFAGMEHVFDGCLETPRNRPAPSTPRAAMDYFIRQPSFDVVDDEVASMDPDDDEPLDRPASPSLSPSPISVPSAPRKKPPASPALNVQAGNSASASKCRERLAAAAKAYRWQQQGGPSPPEGAGLFSAFGGCAGDTMDTGTDNKENVLNYSAPRAVRFAQRAASFAPRTAPRTQDCSVERSHFRGTRKRLDDTLDEITGSSLVTPKRMRVAEELFSKMNI
mmetsp:Transcript_29800/g.65116  ORF Transcript_29800/g.65116 Transcript_29800/m.65116 type:complete len:243 (+) Transcript_29800:344-1072(+)